MSIASRAEAATSVPRPQRRSAAEFPGGSRGNGCSGGGSTNSTTTVRLALSALPFFQSRGVLPRIACVSVCVYHGVDGEVVLLYFQFQFSCSEVLVVIKECKVFASKYIHTVVGHLVSRPWGPRGGAAAPSRNRVQDFPHRVHREMGANPCPQTEAGPTPPEGWGGGTGRWQVHGPLLYPATATPSH